MSRFTVLGGRGYIGSRLAEYLRARGHVCATPEREDPLIFSQALGHVVYAAGLTADFRQRPFETVEAHAGFLSRVLAEARFESLLYLSSTRVYKNSADTHETARLSADPSDPDELYALSKLTGEALCLRDTRPIRVVRLANIFGAPFAGPNFLDSLVQAAFRGQIELQSSPATAKDYLPISDLLPLIEQIALRGQARLYNLASGVNHRHEQVLAVLQAVTGCELILGSSALTSPPDSFAPISIQRIQLEFNFVPTPFEPALRRELESLWAAVAPQPGPVSELNG